MASKRLTAFLDESGNTGANYLDPNQPVHVLGGWIVEDSKREGFAHVVEQAKSAMGMPELKGGKMLGTLKGRREMLRLLESARAFAFPVYSVWEKRFCAALKIVETYFDPMHNPHAGWLPSGANIQRAQVAETLLQALPAGYFERFVAAYRAPSRENLGETARSIATAMKLAGHDQISRTLDACVGEVLDEIVAGEEMAAVATGSESANRASRSVLTSLSYPAFAQIIRAVDFMFEAGSARGVIVHDETSEFASGFMAAFQLFKRVGPDHVGVIEDGRAIRAGIGFVDELRLCKSHDEPLIQAADVLASAVKGQGLAALGALQRDEPLDAMGRLLLGGLLQEQVNSPPWSVVASEDFQSALMRPLIAGLVPSAPR